MHHDPDVGVAAVGPTLGRSGRPRVARAAARFSSSAAFMLMNSASEPVAAIAALTSSTWLESGPEVEVDAEDPVAIGGQGSSGRLAHAARGPEDQRPALAVVAHSVVISVRLGPSAARQPSLA